MTAEPEQLSIPAGDDPRAAMATSAAHALPALVDFEALALEIEKATGSLKVDSEITRGVAAEWLARAKGAVGRSEVQRAALVKPLNDEVSRINAAFKKVVDPIRRAEQDLGKTIGRWTEAERLRVQRENQEAERVRREAAAEAERLTREAERLAAEAKRAEEDAARTAKAPPPPVADDEIPEADTLEAFFEKLDTAPAKPPVAVVTGPSAAEVARQAAEAAHVALEEARAAAVPTAPLQVPSRRVETSRGTLETRTRHSWELEDEALVPREYLSLDRGKVTRAVNGGARAIPGLKIFPVGGAALKKTTEGN